MENITNNQTILEVSKVLGHQVAAAPPLDTSKISLFTEVNPKLLSICNVLKSGTAVNSTSNTMYTTPTDRDFYLVAAHLSVIKDVTSTSILSQIRTTVGNVTNSIISIAGISLTVQENNMSISFPFPLKVDRGATITIQNSTSVANVSASGGFIGFTAEPTASSVN